MDRGGVCLFLGWSGGASWFFPDRCQVVCLVFLCVGVVGVFFELFVFFGGVYVVVLLSTVWRGSSVAFTVLFLLGVYHGYLRCFASCLVIASFLCYVVEYFWCWISFSSFWVASWTTSWSGVFLLRSSSASMCLNGFGLRWSFLWWGGGVSLLQSRRWGVACC